MTTEIKLEPNWEVTTLYFAQVFVQQGFTRDSYEPMVSLIEQVRYLALTDPEALERVLEQLR